MNKIRYFTEIKWIFLIFKGSVITRNQKETKSSNPLVSHVSMSRHTYIKIDSSFTYKILRYQYISRYGDRFSDINKSYFTRMTIVLNGVTSFIGIFTRMKSTNCSQFSEFPTRVYRLISVRKCTRNRTVKRRRPKCNTKTIL